jgi:tetratricopeptide (TPR) repeat protein
MKKEYRALVVVLIIFIYFSLQLSVVQDDSYITFRYIQNFLDGKGFVFNPGERVEGYTNFLWMIILTPFAYLGVDIVNLSRYLGVLSACIAIFFVFKMSRFIFKENEWYMALLPCLLLASNSSFAYWSTSGMESAFFVMMVSIAGYFHLTREKWMLVPAVLSTLIRPEGFLVFGIFLVHGYFFRNKDLRRSAFLLLFFLLMLAPYLIFKLIYYGDLIPNTFYAKTGFSLEYLKRGLYYFWFFLKHYGLFGLLYVLPLYSYKTMEGKQKFIFLMVYIYTLYIVLVGGDVLLAHRFFLPVLPFFYILLTLTLLDLYKKFKLERLKGEISLVLIVALCTANFFLPRNYVNYAQNNEKLFISKMTGYGRLLREKFGAHISIATTTIGAVSYFSRVTVIDMLGLTDSYIANNPEDIPGISSIWREKKFNAEYVLSRDPDFIMFSTGFKPSAPAEKVLFLYSEFRQNYFLYYLPHGNSFMLVYKRKGPYDKPNRLFNNPEFINQYAESIPLIKKKEYDKLIKILPQVIEMGPGDFGAPIELLVECLFEKGNYDEALKWALKAVEIDDYCTRAHYFLYNIYSMKGNKTAAQEEKRKILSINPEVKSTLK